MPQQFNLIIFPLIYILRTRTKREEERERETNGCSGGKRTDRGSEIKRDVVQLNNAKKLVPKVVGRPLCMNYPRESQTKTIIQLTRNKFQLLELPIVVFAIYSVVCVCVQLVCFYFPHLMAIFTSTIKINYPV